MTVDPASAPTRGRMGLHACLLSVAAGPTQFGAFSETPMPGARSGHRHWHAEEDEVTYPDIDLHYIRRNGLRARLHKDGTPYPGWLKETNR